MSSPLRPARAATALVATALACLLALAAAPVAAAASQAYVKYYQVASSYQGKAENLSEISLRFLGTASRSADIYDLNVGRAQPGGGSLGSNQALRAGWDLVLPWDAAGAGVVNGTLPAATPAPPVVVKKPVTPKPVVKAPVVVKKPAVKKAVVKAPVVQAPFQGSGLFAVQPGLSPDVPPAAKRPAAAKQAPAPQPPNPALGGVRTTCQVAANPSASANADWANLRLAADRAWPRSRGGGQMVAVVDSGVDASLPQLAKHVAGGADVLSGTGSGQADCLGSGTAMAGLIVGQSAAGATGAGIAPDAKVMPIQVATTSPRVTASDAVTGLNLAVAGYASVIAVGAYVDVTDPAVQKAIVAATERGAVVVVPAQTSGTPLSMPAGVLRVAGVGIDGQPAAEYLAGAVDVDAPGVGVDALGVTGVGQTNLTGTQYAVAYAAGVIALVRSAYPTLSVAQVVQRVEATAIANSTSHTFGWGMIDPAAAVNQPVATLATPTVARVEAPAGPRATWAYLVIGVVSLLVLLLLAVRIRRLVRGPAAQSHAAAAGRFPWSPSAPGQDEERTLVGAGVGGTN